MSKGIFTEPETHVCFLGTEAPVEESLVQCIALMNRHHILPKAFTITADKYLELVNNLGTKIYRDTDGDVCLRFKEHEVKILCEDV